MHHAHSMQAISATITDSGSDPPASPAPAGIDAAMAAPGAMSVTLWNRTSRSPIAFLRRPAAVVPGSVVAAITPSRRVPARPVFYGNDRMTGGTIVCMRRADFPRDIPARFPGGTGSLADRIPGWDDS